MSESNGIITESASSRERQPGVILSTSTSLRIVPMGKSFSKWPLHTTSSWLDRLMLQSHLLGQNETTDDVGLLDVEGGGSEGSSDAERPLPISIYGAIQTLLLCYSLNRLTIHNSVQRLC